MLPPDPPVSAWTPPPYAVDADGKVVGAVPGTPSNWGRWGAGDQRGTLNLVTPGTVRAGAACVRTGERFALGLPIGGPPTGAVPAAQILRTAAAGDDVLQPSALPAHSDEVLVMGTQSYTQLDGLAHVGADDGTLYNGFWSGLVTADGARRLGIQHLRDGVVGRGVLLDLPRHLGVPVIPHSTEIGPELLDAALAGAGVTLAPGDSLLVRTGALGAWDGRHGSLGISPQAGLAASCAGWIATHDLALVGADNSAVEALDASSGSWEIPLHVAALRDLGMPLAELLWLDDLAAACATDGTCTFLFVALPLPLLGAAGSPLNPLAIR